MFGVSNGLCLCSCGEPTSVGYSSADASDVGKRILAERYKTKICRNYMDFGSCPYEIRCMFAHGEHELRTAEMNFNDGLVTEEAIRAFQRYWRDAALTSQRRQQQHPHRLMCGHHRRSYAAPPSFYSPVCGSLETMSTSTVANSCTHNPYSCDILAPEGRLYSKPPASSLTGCALVPRQSQCDEFENTCTDARLAVVQQGEVQEAGFCCDNVNGQTVIAAEPCYGYAYSSRLDPFESCVGWKTQHSSSTEKDDEEAGCSACSSVGSESGEHQQPSLGDMNIEQCEYDDKGADKAVDMQ